MKLYYAETLNPRRACAVARLLGSPVELVRVDLGRGEHTRPDYLAINPNGKVPALTDGATTLWEANAIMCHLAAKAGSDLWPGDERRRVEIIRWFSWNADHFTRHGGTLYFNHIIKPRLGMGPADAGAVEEATGHFRRFAAVLNAHLDGRRYLVDDALTLADFAVASCLPYAAEARIPLGDFPAVERWHDRLNELEAWREPFPKLSAAA
jgi:glutathione S-transferase